MDDGVNQSHRGDWAAEVCFRYMIQFLKAGSFVKDKVWHAPIVVISHASYLHGYTIRSLYKAVQISGDQESLVRVAVWCIGEYGEMLVNNAGMLGIEEPITAPDASSGHRVFREFVGDETPYTPPPKDQIFPE